MGAYKKNKKTLSGERLIEREQLLRALNQIIMVWINKWSWRIGVEITQSKTDRSKVTKRLMSGASFVSLAAFMFISEPRFCEKVEIGKEQMFQNTTIITIMDISVDTFEQNKRFLNVLP